MFQFLWDLHVWGHVCKMETAPHLCPLPVDHQPPDLYRLLVSMSVYVLLDSRQLFLGCMHVALPSDSGPHLPSLFINIQVSYSQ